MLYCPFIVVEYEIHHIFATQSNYLNMKYKRIILTFLLSLFIGEFTTAAEKNRPSPEALRIVLHNKIALHNKRIRQRDLQIMDDVECYLHDGYVFVIKSTNNNEYEKIFTVFNGDGVLCIRHGLCSLHRGGESLGIRPCL